MLAHPTGIAEIYLGEVTGTKIELGTDVVARTTSAKEVTAGTGSTAWSADRPGLGVRHGRRGPAAAAASVCAAEADRDAGRLTLIQLARNQ